MLPLDVVKRLYVALYGQAYSVTGRKSSDAVTVLAANGRHEPLHEMKHAAPDGDGEVSENPPSGVFGYFFAVEKVTLHGVVADRGRRNSPHGKGKNQIIITARDIEPPCTHFVKYAPQMLPLDVVKTRNAALYGQA